MGSLLHVGIDLHHAVWYISGWSLIVRKKRVLARGQNRCKKKGPETMGL